MAASAITQLRAQFRELGAYEFEKFVAALWELQGWQTWVTPESGDDGIDIVAEDEPTGTRVKIQAKRKKEGDRVGVGKLQRYTIGDHEDYHLSVVVTTSSFSSYAQDYAEKANIVLINGTRLSDIVQDLDAGELLTDYVEERDWSRLDFRRYRTSEQIPSGFPNYTTLSDDEPTMEEDRTPPTDDVGRESSDPADEPTEVVWGIGSKRSNRLSTAGVQNVSDLRSIDPEELAREISKPTETVKKWANRAVYREESTRWIDGIGDEYSRQLAEAGIETVGELATADSEEVADQTALSRETAETTITNAGKWEGIPPGEIRGIDSAYAGRLSGAGIRTVRDLSEADPEELAEEADLSEKDLRKWIMEAADSRGKYDVVDSMVVNSEKDVDCLRGIGEKSAESLAEAGIETVGELATADPEVVAVEAGLSESRVREFTQRARYQPRL